MSEAFGRMRDSGTVGPPGPSSPGPSVGPNIGPGTGSMGLLRVVSPAQVTSLETRARENREQMIREINGEQPLDELVAYVRKQFDIMRRHRDSSQGWTDRLLRAMRMFNGHYDPSQLAAIQEFGGSEIYARLVAVKCRGATSLLRDIYLQQQRPWDIAPTPEPDIPDDKRDQVDRLLQAEVGLASMAAAQQAQAPPPPPPGGMGGVPSVTGAPPEAPPAAAPAGPPGPAGPAPPGAPPGMAGPAPAPLQPPSEEEIAQRKTILDAALEQAAQKKAREEAREAFKYLDDIFVEGGFYSALSEFLVDLPIFPFACIRGPVVHIVPTLKWEKNPANPQAPAKAVRKAEPRMFWRRVSPFDLWWSPGASTVEAADFIYRERKSRGEVDAMIGVAGYKDDAIKELLDKYTGGYAESPDSADSTRAELESRENPHMNESGMFDCMEFNGVVRGKLLREWGMPAKDVPDEARSYAVQIWFIGEFVIKAQLMPSPRDRAPFFISSFDKVPGTMVGNALPDVLADLQDVCNACLRSLVNNLAMSSGPMVGVDEEMMASTEDVSTIFPWKVWRFARRPGVTSQGQPISFFQPANNAQALLGVYEKMTQIADEVSAIPRYITGSERMGGAGRTASGLAMLMGNASKILQTVAGNIDRDVFQPSIQMLYDIVMLTDRTGRLRGDENIVVKGVTVAIQRETERQRQIEMLQATANPLDSQIVGIRGRGALLRSIASTLGLDGDVIVPSDQELEQREKMAQAAAVAQAQMGGPPGGPGGPGGPGAQAQGAQAPHPQNAPGPQGPRVNLQQQAPQP